MTKFDQRYPSARTGSGKAGWPRGVHKISQIGLDNIGVDEPQNAQSSMLLSNK
jgi:hypothetical protein